MHAPILAPSILAGDHANLAASAALVEQLGIPWIHLDIMDGHFVPNLSFGPQTVAALRKPDVLDWMKQNGLEPIGSSPEEYGDYIRAELVKWAKAVKDAKISAN